MISDWADRLDQLGRSPALPMWLMLAVAGFFGLVLLATLLRAERSIANGTLALLTVTAIAIAVVVLFRSSASNDAAAPVPTSQSATPSPALACLDDLAGETVLTACEKTLFSSPDMAASAVAYTAAQLSRLKAYGDVNAANRVMTPELDALRRAVERDRYGLVAYVLSVRDRCTPERCAAYGSLTDSRHVAANMTGRSYEAMIERHAANWNAAPATGSASLMTPTQPTGRPTTVDFPTSASIPPVNIMTAEPPLPAARAPAAAAPPPPAAPRPVAATTPPAAPKKAPAAKKQASPAPVPLSPAPSSTASDAREP